MYLSVGITSNYEQRIVTKETETTMYSRKYIVHQWTWSNYWTTPPKKKKKQKLTEHHNNGHGPKNKEHCIRRVYKSAFQRQ